ncbi:MAG TPA: hypothetical protein VIG71_11665 [Enteractinococcus sp.]
MSPHRFALPRYRKLSDHPREPSELGMFMVSMEIFVAAMLLAIGVHFLTVASEPDALAWGAFALIVIIMGDAVRRLINIATGKAPA